MVGLFGTKGIRGSVRDEFTVDAAIQLGKAIGKYFNGTLAMVTDGRSVSDMIKCSVSAGLTATGCDVLDMGIMPLSVMQMYVGDKDNLAGGISIISFDGSDDMVSVKCIFSDGIELSEGGRSKIEANYNDSIRMKSASEIGHIDVVEKMAYRPYLESIMRNTDVQLIKRANLSVVMDCANSPSSLELPDILRRLGVRVVTLNSDLSVDRPGRSDWKSQDDIIDLMELTRINGADLGIATDINGDRVKFVTDEGVYIEVDQVIAIISKYIQSAHPGSAIVYTVDSSDRLENIIKEQGGVPEQSQSGTLRVISKMKETSAPFGANGSGGYIFANHQYCRDPGMAIVKMLCAIAKNGPLSVQMSELPRYTVERRDIDCPEGMKDAVMDMISELHAMYAVKCADGVHFKMDDGTVFIRPSGTDHKIRLMAESSDIDTAKELADTFSDDIERYINT